MLDAKLDPYSSAPTFDGWARPWKFRLPASYAPLPVSPPQTALLDRRWKPNGLVDPWERPGPLR
jgi:hypothetical protein